MPTVTTTYFSSTNNFSLIFFFFFQAEDGIRDRNVTGVQTCALPIYVGGEPLLGPDQMHGFEERLTTDIYPADYGWTPDWDRSEERRVGKEWRGGCGGGGDRRKGWCG